MTEEQSILRTLNLGLDIVNGVGRFDLEGDGLTRKGFYENLHDGLEIWSDVNRGRGHRDYLQAHLDKNVVLNLQQRCSIINRR